MAPVQQTHCVPSQVVTNRKHTAGRRGVCQESYKEKEAAVGAFFDFFLGSSAASFRGKTLHLLQTTKPSQVTTEVLFRGSFQLSVRRFPPVKPNLIFKQSISLTSPPSDGANHINRLSAYSYRNVFFFFYFEI